MAGDETHRYSLVRLYVGSPKRDLEAEGRLDVPTVFLGLLKERFIALIDGDRYALAIL